MVASLKTPRRDDFPTITTKQLDDTGGYLPKLKQTAAKTPGREVVGTVNKNQVKEIAQQKMKDLNCDTVEAAMRMVEGSARSMGIQVSE